MPKAFRPALLLALALAPSAAAQPSPEIAARLEAIGRVVAPPETAAIYAPLHPRGPQEGIRIGRDLRYGEDPRHRLDVFAPEPSAAAGPPRPVLVFVHGGAFIGGDKQLPGNSPFYSNIGLWAARNGFVGVNPTYRLAPAHPFPAAQEDLAAALAWVGANIGAHGGDPARVALMGHSAGASHVAAYAAEPRFHPPDVAAPTRYALVSGLYDLTTGPAPGSAYFGTDPAERRARNPQAGLLRITQPILLAHASLDPPIFVAQAESLRAALCDAGRCPTALVLGGHSHMSEVYAVNTADTALTAPLLEFLRR